MKRITFFILLTLCITSSVYAQPWLDFQYLGKEKSQANFFDIQKAFYKYWGDKSYENPKDKAHESEVGGYTQFKRWEYFMKPLAYPDGKLPQPLKYWNEYQKFIANESKEKRDVLLTNSWTPLGMTDWINGNSGYSPGNGRINAIAVDPNNANVIYAGSPSGGVWKSNNGGATWNTTFDYMPRIGVSTIVIDKNNSNIVYIGTGDRDAGDCAGIGILKSIDAGSSWNMTGMDNTSNGNVVCRMLINPMNSNSIIAACSDGMYKSNNAATTWTKWSGSSSQFYDVEYKPGDTTIVYATTSDSFYKSVNGGKTFTKITSTLPSGSTRYEIAVAPSNSNYVYLVASNGSYTFGGLYRSTDSGASFAVQSTTPNIFDYATDGSGTSGQGWYDLCIVVSPTNAEEIYVGSINQWKSTDGGVNWTNLTNWTYPPSTPGQYTHCDEHELIYPAGGTKIYTGTDGGIYYSTNGGVAWTNISAGLGITQCYKLGGTESDANLIVAGAQDNGVIKYSGSSTWIQLYGADGFESAIDFTDKTIIYSEVYNGSMLKSTDGGNNWATDVQPSGQSGAWCTPFIIHPTNHNLLYMGFNDVYKTSDGTSSWTAISSGLCSSSLSTLESAPSDSNYIYAAYNSDLYVTKNSGTNWATKTPNSSMYITGIVVDETNPAKLWICGTGTSTSKVYYSKDAGNSWTDITSNLTNLGFNCIIHQTNANDGLYLGTEVGVFYKDTTMVNWISYNSNLPNVRVTDFEINYSAGMIRAATYGRSVWESQLYTTVNIKENELNNSLSVYPVPAKDKFNVLLSLKAEKNIHLALFDVTGRLIKSVDLGKLKNVSYSIDISTLVEGTYFIKVEAGNSYIIKKVSKI
ncbi:MAG: T9SS type A sorting domain-containing protein [Bacteroidales bacterium]|jgi:photosystem II stability/assembly factor-like uncharacterized protein